MNGVGRQCELTMGISEDTLVGAELRDLII